MFSPLRKSDPDWFEFAWLDALINEWVPGEIVAVGTLRRPLVPFGYMLKCTVAGQTGPRERAWPTSGTIKDGSVTWQVVQWAAPDLPSIASCTYAIQPSGVTVLSEAIDSTLLSTRIRLDAASAEVGEYTITATMIDGSGEQYVASENFEVIE